MTSIDAWVKSPVPESGTKELNDDEVYQTADTLLRALDFVQELPVQLRQLVARRLIIEANNRDMSLVPVTDFWRKARELFQELR